MPMPSPEVCTTLSGSIAVFAKTGTYGRQPAPTVAPSVPRNPRRLRFRPMALQYNLNPHEETDSCDWSDCLSDVGCVRATSRSKPGPVGAGDVQQLQVARRGPRADVGARQRRGGASRRQADVV